MANHKSAIKRHRQNLKKNEKNSSVKSAIRTVIKSSISAKTAGEVEKAQELAKKATSLLDKAAIHGVIHKSNAARRISKLYKNINS